MTEEYTTISFTEEEMDALDAVVTIAWEGIPDDSSFFNGVRSLVKTIARARNVGSEPQP